MGCGKRSGLVAVSVLFHLFPVIAQPGFLSISCGGSTTHTDDNNITWVSDADYIDVGVPADVGNATLEAQESYLQTLRFFPKPLKKSCYHLPLVPKLPYLLRLWFAIGNYSGLQSSNMTFAFSVETLGMLYMQNMGPFNLTNSTPPFKYEEVLVSSGAVLYICLIRTSETNDPFISAIELRALRHGMYKQAKPGIILNLVARVDLGGESLVRYHQDEFDRVWIPFGSCQNQLQAKLGNSKHRISAYHTQNIPPSIVMQTACVATNGTLIIGLPGGRYDGQQTLLLFYFADIEPADMTFSFSVSINGESRSNNITLARNYSALEGAFVVNGTQDIGVTLSGLTNSTGAIVNALECYTISHTQPETYSEDIEALQTLQTRFGIKDWLSDPCYLIDWKGIVCDNSSSSVRISEINLSGWNLTGPVPDTLGELTALVSLSLENNHLTGPLPDFSNLIKLERLHLQNNNLTGGVPDWLCGLENLRELFIENNSFGGVIPCNLFNKRSLKFRYSGNRNLHIPSNPKKNRWVLVLGIILGASLVIGLVFIVIIVVLRKKIRRKQSSRVEKDSKDALDEDNSAIIMPNTAKSRAFTLEEITEATQNFSQKIGAGGFGSVFLGKLQHGKDIAVKVLSLFSKQGVQEFLNEVELLSKIHHKNLVSLLGYCGESRELMIVYEYMSGGSLKDHLYGPLADLSPINWITRLKIALDAAEGLEYLHVGCTTRVIHRDIKSANILLDKNCNGKLADFGLSRVTIDGEASHVTTTVKGTLGYLDPEYFSTQMLTEKSDVYSFGVVLLEMICGRQPVDANLPEEQLNLIRWVTPYVEMEENPGKMVEIVDKRLGRNYDIESITVVAKLAIRCVQAEPSSRPSVHEIVAEIKKAIKLKKDKASSISDIDIEYGDLDLSLASLSVDSSVRKEMDSAESSSNKLSTLSQGR